MACRHPFRLHRWTLAVYALGLAHAIGSGTDARAPWFLAILAATAAPPPA